MRSRPAVGLAAALTAIAASVATAQPPRPSAAAPLPPDRAVLDRLNLRTEWYTYLPIDGRRDAINRVEVVDEGQMFVQTRTGTLIAIEQATGRTQWAVALNSGNYMNSYPVFVTDRLVFAVAVTKLIALHRYTGMLEFSYDMGHEATTGPSATGEGFAVIDGRLQPVPARAFVVTDGNRVAALNLPAQIRMPEKRPNLPGVRDVDLQNQNPTNVAARRYPGELQPRADSEIAFEGNASRRDVTDPAPSSLTGSRSPSLAVVPTVSHPYTLDGQHRSPSLNVMHSFRPPYRLSHDFDRNVQRSPSIASIPPSVAASLALTDLRPKAVQPTLRWEFAMTQRVLFTPVLAAGRVWLVGEGRAVFALNQLDHTVQARLTAADRVSAPPAQAGVMGYVPLADGTLTAVDLSAGNTVNAKLVWRSVIGGLLNRKPVAVSDAVFVAGDSSGVARIDRATGELMWRTGPTIDRVVAVNQEFVYARDQLGRLQVLDARRASAPVYRTAYPLSGIDVARFNVPVTNDMTDRVVLATDGGLLVCLRDASAKYVRPVRMAPPPPPDLKDNRPEGAPMAAPDAEMKKDEMKKEAN